MSRRSTLTLAAVTVTVLAVVWVATYLALGLPVSAAIPFTYQVASIATLVVFARTKDYRVLPVQPAAPHHPAAVPAPVEPRRLRRVERCELWALVAPSVRCSSQRARGRPMVRRLRRADGRLRARSTAARRPPRPSRPGPDGLLRAQHRRRVADRLPAPPVRGPRPRRRPRQLRAACSSTSCRGRSPSGSSARPGSSPRRHDESRSCSPTSSASPRSRSGRPRAGGRRARRGLQRASTSSPSATAWRRSRPSATRTWSSAACPDPRPDHAEAVAEMALAMQDELGRHLRGDWARPRDPDRDPQRARGGRRDRAPQVHLRPVGRHGEHRQPDGVARPAGADPGHRGGLRAPALRLRVRGARRGRDQGQGTSSERTS